MPTRGVIMYGPPGTGKSSVLQQVVEMMVDRGDIVLFVNDGYVLEAALKEFRCSLRSSRST